jgi:hypothetical protein
MKSKALDDLIKIASIEGIGHGNGKAAREKAIMSWVEDYITEVEVSQPIIKQGLTSEDEDFVKYYMAYKIGDELMNDCIAVESKPNRITTKVWALRRK